MRTRQAVRAAIEQSAVRVCLTFLLCAWASPTRAQEIRVVGRLDARVRLEPARDGAAIVGVLTDETGAPVAGTIAISHPEAAWQSCLGGPAGPRTSFETDSSGRFCLSGPALPVDAMPVLHLTAEGYRDGEVAFGAIAASAEAPRWISAPEVIDLDGREPFEVRASADAMGQSSLELELDCSGRRSSLGTAALREGVVRFMIDPGSLPGPGQCAFVLRLDQESARRPVALRARASLTALDWSTHDGLPVARVQATLHWRDQTRPLTEGLLEVREQERHVASATLDPAGIGALELARTPSKELTVRLLELPAYAREPAPLQLPPPSPWTYWHAIEAALLVLLGVWLASSWRSVDRRTPPPPANDRTPAVRRARPSAILGKVLDAHTGAPIPEAQVAVLSIGTSAQELVATLETDAAGAFTVAPPDAALTRLRVSADRYLTFEGHLSGREPTIRLAARRRAALDLLAGWVRGQEWLARVKGMPAVPTPGQVSRAARSSGRAGVAEWAEGVSRAAYGPSPPSDADLSALAERKPS